jgi:8-oxo-dGTP pyrophosphatase MutT (NUDIX family)
MRVISRYFYSLIWTCQLISDSFPYYSESPEAFKQAISNYYHLKFQGYEATLGYVPSSVVKRLPLLDLWKLDEVRKVLTWVAITDPSVDEPQSRILAAYLQELRDQKFFSVLDGWRDELYPIYGPGRKLLLNMERSATPLFGIVTYGVHMTAYVRTEEGLKIWTPRRAKTKQTYPGMMDNTVAGGITTGERPLECLIREAQEEASLPEDIVRNAKSCGTLTYFHVRDARAGGETGLCQPECQYVYDLELPEDVIPKPGDNEAVDFQLLTVLEVQEAMAGGKFKPNCALLILDFFIRHGILTPENEPDYAQIVPRLHRKLEFHMA